MIELGQRRGHLVAPQDSRSLALISRVKGSSSDDQSGARLTPWSPTGRLDQHLPGTSPIQTRN